MTDYERNADVSKTLTEQWKAGELEQGWYYVKGADGLFGMMSDYALYRVNLEHPDNTISLLAPVPSYEEWQAKDKENKQLKELLKECQYMILAYSINHDTFTKEKVLDTVKQIDNAIGEK